MNLFDAIPLRYSARSYTTAPLTADQQLQLHKAISVCNKRSGLHAQLVCDQPKPFASIIRSYGMLRGVRHFIVLAGKASLPDLEEKCGYFGEQLVLTATALGLGTCWVNAATAFGYGPALQELFAPDKGEFVSLVTLGHPDHKPRTPARKPGRWTIR